MRKLTPENTAAAVERNYARKCTVRPVSFDGVRGMFHVLCDKEHTHTVKLERKGTDIYADCFFEGTGEVCPAELGRRVCYHQTAAVLVFQAWEAMREVQKLAASRGHRGRSGIQSAVINGKRVEHVRGFRL